MKYFIILFFIFASLLSKSQTIKENHADNKIQFKISPNIPICWDNTKEVLLSVSMRSYYDEETDIEPFYVIFFGFTDVCILDSDDVGYIYLENGKIIELSRITEDKCGENISIGYIPVPLKQNKTTEDLVKEKQQNMNQLKENKWVKIEFYTSTRYLEFENFAGIRNPNKIFKDLTE